MPGGINGGRTLINGEVTQPILVTLPDVKSLVSVCEYYYVVSCTTSD